MIIKQFHRIGLYLLLRLLSGEISRLEAGLPELVRRRKAAALKMEEMGIKEPAESGWSFKKYPL